jgi:hypothetical protein
LDCPGEAVAQHVMGDEAANLELRSADIRRDALGVVYATWSVSAALNAAHAAVVLQIILRLQGDAGDVRK